MLLPGGVYSKLEEQAEVDQSIRALLDKVLSYQLARCCPVLTFDSVLTPYVLVRRCTVLTNATVLALYGLLSAVQH